MHKTFCGMALYFSVWSAGNPDGRSGGVFEDRKARSDAGPGCSDQTQGGKFRQDDRRIFGGRELRKTVRQGSYRRKHERLMLTVCLLVHQRRVGYKAGMCGLRTADASTVHFSQVYFAHFVRAFRPTYSFNLTTEEKQFMSNRLTSNLIMFVYSYLTIKPAIVVNWWITLQTLYLWLSVWLFVLS